MARSPHLRSIFLDFEFKPVYLPEEYGIAPPTDISSWMHRFQAMSIEGSAPEASIQVSTPVGEENSGSQDGNNPHQILEECIQEAIDSNSNCQIHAEVKVLGYFQGHDLFGKAINSVGINKFCCPACLEYVHTTSTAIQVGGTHNKWYPWHLSLHTKYLSLDQLKRMRLRVLQLFNDDWATYLLDRQRSHSFGNQSESSGGDVVLATEWNVPDQEYDTDKLLRGDYREYDGEYDGDYD